MTDASEFFDWANSDSVCVHNQPTTAVYTNNYEQVVIRQEAGGEVDHDCCVHISRDNVLIVVRAMLRIAGYEHAYLYRQTAGGRNDISWPEDPYTRGDVATINARPHTDWAAAREAETVSERLDQEPETQPERVPLKQRRARVADLLKSDPARSNRSIAADCGVSDKTVAAVRAEIQNRSAENSRDGAEFRSQETRDVVAAE